MAGCLAIFDRSLLEFLLITLFVVMLKKKVGSKATTTLLPFPYAVFQAFRYPDITHPKLHQCRQS